MTLADASGRLIVKVTPNAGREAILLPDDATIPQQLHIRVTASPEDGKANHAVLKLLSKALGVPKTSLSIAAGQTARTKTILIRR